MKAEPGKQNGRAEVLVARAAAEFIAREAGTESLITVIRAHSIAHGDRMLVFISVFPIEKARGALSFLERQREAFSDYLKQRVRMRLPRVDFMLDSGEELAEHPKS
jgi:hypothetical protein